MRITILQGAFLPVPPLCGGAVEKRWFKLGQIFAKRGEEVTHISRSYKGLPSYEVINGVQHIRVKGYDAPGSVFRYKLLDGVYSCRACRAVPEWQDIVVTNSFWSPVILCLYKKGKIYVDVARMPKGQMRIYRAAAILRANSTPVADAIKTELPAKDHDRVSLIPNPLPFDIQGNLLDLSQKSKIILYCGRVHPEKGLELLLESAKRLSASDWRIQVVGPWDVKLGGGGGGYLSNLKELFAGYAIDFLDPVFDEKRLLDYYRQASIFIYPSVAERGETFGLAPLEAMAWGAVPVVSDLSCFKDFITDETNGLIFDHRASNAQTLLWYALERLINEKNFRLSLATRALDVRSSHSLNRIADLFLADFKRVLA